MIEISHLTKKFGKKVVLEDLTMTIQTDVIHGFIGGNGAGKTTLLKLICGIYRPDKGRIIVDGSPVYENESVKRKFFMLTEELYFLPQADLKAMEQFYRGYYEFWSSEIYQTLISWFGLPMEKEISSFSKGMQRMAGLAAAFSSGAKYLFLDEAFDGLDLSIRKMMRKMMRSYQKKREAAILLTSHNLAELEECADRFSMIQEGKLLCDKTVEEIRQTGNSLESYFLKEKKERSYDWNQLF